MRKFIQKALKKLSKLDMSQIHALIYDIASDNEQLEVVLDSMTDGVVVMDTDNKIVLMNKAAERYLPLHYQDYPEKYIWDIINDQEIARFLQRVLENQEKITDKEFTLDNNGIMRILGFSVIPLVRDRKVQGNIIHVEDVTEKRSKEARLRRAENLASLTTLAAGVAHEIKNPLGSISIHIQLIQKALDSQQAVDPDSLKRYIDVVNEEVERLNYIVMDFLFAVRPMDMKLEIRNINAIIHELLDFVHFELEKSNIMIIEELDSNIPEIPLAEKYIKQALLNLIKNALSAMPDGGIIILKTEEIDNQVRVSISDTGVGISEQNMEKIFDPYFTTRDFGSGLGLTVVYKIIKEHRGDITLKSKEGEGTTFTITLPVLPKDQRLIGEKG